MEALRQKQETRTMIQHDLALEKNKTTQTIDDLKRDHVEYSHNFASMTNIPKKLVAQKKEEEVIYVFLREIVLGKRIYNPSAIIMTIRDTDCLNMQLKSSFLNLNCKRKAKD
jgi:hypothetical protein